jgi:hypothetical protein
MRAVGGFRKIGKKRQIDLARFWTLGMIDGEIGKQSRV